MRQRTQRGEYFTITRAAQWWSTYLVLYEGHYRLRLTAGEIVYDAGRKKYTLYMRFEKKAVQ